MKKEKRDYHISIRLSDEELEKLVAISFKLGNWCSNSAIVRYCIKKVYNMEVLDNGNNNYCVSNDSN